MQLSSSNGSGFSRSVFRSSTLAASILLSVFSAGALFNTPAANAAPSIESIISGQTDITNGGRLGAGSSDLRLPEGISLGSLGGAELSQVSALDPARYAGKWYQVAAVPQPFTVQCASNTTAEYGIIDPANISVKNSCRTVLGGQSSISGSARIQDPEQPASLRVSFEGIPGQSPNGSVNYRVTYLAEDYSLAIVGDPQRLSGFVLSRTPSLTTAQWNTVKSVTAARGWWNCAFLTTPQDKGLKNTQPLCSI